MLHDTWVQWTISPCYQDPLTHHLFVMQLSCGMGHRMITLVKEIKHVRHIHIISCIIFSNLVLDMYFQDTDTRDSCDMHDYMTFLDIPCYFILWSRVLVIVWLCYTTVTCPGHFMFIIYMSHYACTVSLYMIYHLDYSCYYYYLQFSILPNILLLCPVYCYYFFIFSLLSFFFLRVLLLVRFWWTFILFFSI